MSGKLQETETVNTISLTPTLKKNIHDAPKVWGRLLSTYTYLEPVDLENKSFTLGRSDDCDVTITERKIPIHKMVAISKSHFVITRENSLVYIRDLSKNGTYLNGNLIGKGNTHILQNDDVISIGFQGLKVYLFKTIAGVDCNTYLPTNLRPKYQVSRLLGVGACGEVKLVHEKQTLRPFAVKKIVKGKPCMGKNPAINNPEKIHREITILRELEHPCIIGMKEIEETDDAVFIILEYMEGGELSHLVQSAHPLDESQAKQLFYQIALGLEYLHSRGVIHRDLKPDNVLLKASTPDSVVKISDFGLSRILDSDEMMKTMCGTPNFLAPEIVARKPYDPKVDIWSLGVLLFYMLSQEYPFRGNTMEKLNDKILNAKFDMEGEKWADISENAKDLVARMLTVDPGSRISLSGILEHAWIVRDRMMLRRVREMLHAEGRTGLAVDSDGSSFLASSSEDSPPSKRSRTSF